ncbi:MAG: OB-fold nucleic acid binding domain-containing protein [Candidatus Heimdallarchaeota archaeon]|nr:OB-fold nucleic acid binding domain-containing protein [Candidatus Heimdallarchaeota archaeon]MDH5647969.1 OB-fold nucleic acid binding domain-containing protein [Candidatus Heimdallarchaeota archaeon]
MKVRKRKPGKLMRISQIYLGEIIDLEDQKIYRLNNKVISKVRIFGVVLSKNEYSNEGNKNCIILLDDGSDTIELRMWSRPIKRDDGSIEDQYTMINPVKEGQIIDVIGKVREYNEEMYIIPEIIQTNLSIQWEINRRANLIKLQSDLAD